MTAVVLRPTSAGICDRCGDVGERWLVIDRPDDRMPSHWLHCARCTQPDTDTDTNTEEALVTHRPTGRVLLSAAATLEDGGPLDPEHVIRRAAAAIAPDPAATAGHAAALVMVRLGVEDLTRWASYPSRTRADVVAVLRQAGREWLAQHPDPDPDPLDLPHVEMVDGGPPVPTTQLRDEDRLLTVEKAVMGLIDRFDTWGGELAQAVRQAVTEQRERVDTLDGKVTAFTTATATELAEVKARLAALEARLGDGIAGEAEAWLRGQGEA